MLFEIGVDFRRKVVDRSFHWPADKFRLGFRAKFPDVRAGGQRRRFSSFFVSDAGGMPFIEQIDENAEPRQTAREPRIGIHLKEHVLHFVDCHGLSVQRVRKNGLEAIVLRDDDELIEVKATDNTEDIFLITKKGMCIRFHETDVRVTGRVSMGVIGMKFDEGDEVIGMQMASQGECLLVVSENGYGKRTPIDEFTAQNRGGKGVRCYKIIDKTGDLVGAKLVDNERKIMLITNEGIIIKMAVSDISIIGRNTSGVKLMSIDAESGIAVASIAKVRESDKDEDEEDEFLEEQDGEETESENMEE